MKSLRVSVRQSVLGRNIADRYRRSAFGQYFANVPPIDRAAWWISVALILALAVSLHALSRKAPPRLEWIEPTKARFAGVRP